MKRIVISSLISGMVLATSCGISTSEANGTMTLNIQWPQKNFQLQAIPQETESIKIDITGIGLKTTQSRTVTRSAGSQERVVFSLPIGQKQVRSSAMDGNNNVIAAAAKSVVIEGGKQVQAVLEMKRIRNSIFDPLIDSSLPAQIITPTTPNQNTGLSNPNATSNNGQTVPPTALLPGGTTTPAPFNPTNPTTTTPGVTNPTIPGTSVTTGPVNITSVSSSSGSPGTTVTIFGSGFSANAVSNVVLFGASLAIVTSASPGQLNVVVPGKTGTVDIKVLVGASVSNTLSFSIQGDDNKSPDIESFTANPATISGLGYPTELSVIAEDDDDNLKDSSYKWSCKDTNGNACGSFNKTDSPKVIWTSPTSDTGPYNLKVEVTDNVNTVVETLSMNVTSFSANVTFNGGHK